MATTHANDVKVKVIAAIFEADHIINDIANILGTNVKRALIDEIGFGFLISSSCVIRAKPAYAIVDGMLTEKSSNTSHENESLLTEDTI